MNASHLIIVKPERCLQVVDFMNHLRIKLLVDNLTRVVNKLPFRNRETNVSTTVSVRVSVRVNVRVSHWLGLGVSV